VHGRALYRLWKAQQFSLIRLNRETNDYDKQQRIQSIFCFNIAFTAIRVNPMARRYYEKKREEGKVHRKAFCAWHGNM